MGSEMCIRDRTLDELATSQDKWLYIFRHLPELQAIPPALQEDIFLKLFEVAQIARFNRVERHAYEDSLKYYRDLKNVTDTARGAGREEGLEQGLQKGLQKGREQGAQETRYAIAQKLRAEGLSEEQIARLTGLNASELKTL